MHQKGFTYVCEAGELSVSVATEERRSWWRNLSVMPDSGSLVYWILKIKGPLSHHKRSSGQVKAF